MSWLFFALVAPLLWAVSNFVDKHVLDRHTTGIFDFLFLSSVFSWLFFAVFVFIFGFPALDAYSIIPIAMGVLLIVSYGFYGKALEQGETSQLVILFKLIPVFTLILGFIFLGQVITVTEMLAFVLVLIGATFISLERLEGKLFLARGIRWILVAIILWAIILLFSDYALEQMPFWDFFILDTLGAALVAPFLLLHPYVRAEIVLGIRTATQSKYGWFFLNDVLDTVGQMSIKKSLALAPSAGLVSVVMQVQAFYAIAIGILLTLLFPKFITEDISLKTIAKKTIGAIVMFMGILLLI